MCVRGKIRKRKPTTTAVSRRSPMQPKTDQARLRWLDENRCIQCGMVVGTKYIPTLYKEMPRGQSVLNYCLHEFQNDDAACEWKIGESLRRQACRVFASESSAGTRDWLAPSLSNKSGSIFRWRSNNDAEYFLLESMLRANKATRCEANSSFGSTQHYLLQLHVF